MSRLIDWPAVTGPEEAVAVSRSAADEGQKGATLPQVPAGSGHDKWLARVGKMVPAEVAVFYLPATRLIEGGGSRIPTDVLQWATFGLALAASFLYVLKLGVDAKRPWKTQALVTACAFLFWSYALKGPWGDLYDGVMAGLLLGVFSLMSGLVTRPYVDQQ